MATSAFRVRDYRRNGNLGALGAILLRAAEARYRRGNIALAHDTTINIAITLFHSRLLRGARRGEAKRAGPSSPTYSATCPLRSLAAPVLSSFFVRADDRAIARRSRDLHGPLAARQNEE